MKAKFLGDDTEVGDIVEVTNGDGKGTVVITINDDDSREIWITGQTNKGDFRVFTDSDGKLDKIQVTGDYGTSDKTEYRHQPNGHLSGPTVVSSGMQR